MIAQQSNDVPLKPIPNSTITPFGKTMRENCYKRVREDRTRLLWKMRSPAAQSLIDKEFIKSTFQEIVSDELKKIKDSSLSDCLESSNSVPKATDELWEYNGLQDAYQGECEELLLEMQRIFYEDLRTEPARKEPEDQIKTWADEEDEYLARAVSEHMQLKDEQVQCTSRFGAPSVSKESCNRSINLFIAPFAIFSSTEMMRLIWIYY
ncbi:Uncharacterized protein TCM_002533 isoform 3, partial [Theobroma cacao]